MSRLIDPVPRDGGRLFAGEDKKEKGQEFGERVAKYVPAEIIATYLTLLSFVLAGTDADSDRRILFLGIIFLVGLIFTPLYIRSLPGITKVKRYHYFLSTAAFVFWAYSIPGGFFDDLGIYDQVAAAILLAIFTLASGLTAPTEK